MNDISKDISLFTGLSEDNISYITNIIEDIICEDVYESIINHESVTEINLGYGILYIKLETESIKYKFIPNKNLIDNINNIFKNKEYTFKSKINKTLTDRITKTYKELL